MKIKECLAKLKAKLPKRKKSQNDDMAFFLEHKEEIEYLVKYFPVIKKVILSVGNQEIAVLNKNEPCKYRKASDVPFRCECALKIDGESEKKIAQCEKCEYKE